MILQSLHKMLFTYINILKLFYKAKNPEMNTTSTYDILHKISCSWSSPTLCNPSTGIHRFRMKHSLEFCRCKVLQSSGVLYEENKNVYQRPVEIRKRPVKIRTR